MSARRARWLLFLAGAPLLFVGLRALDPVGDRGMANVLGFFAALLYALLWLGLFLWRGGLDARGRVRLLAGLLAAGAIAALLVRVDGFHGDMIPILSWRAGPAPAAELPPDSAAARPDSASAAAGTVDLARTSAADFPGFLGPTRDGRVAVALAVDWTARPPRRLWRAPIGAGWSGFAVVNGWALTLEQAGDEELVSARSLATGAVAWTRRWRARYEHVLGGDGPRSTPAIAGGRVVVLGASGHLACLAGSDGTVLWEHELQAEYGVAPEEEAAWLQYGRANSPLVVGARVIVPVGGDPAVKQAGLVAFDLASGAVLWEGPGRAISYSSPALGVLGGGEQVLIVNEDTLSGHELATGRILWEHPWPGSSSGDANVSQAVPLEGERVFVSKGYGGGGLLLALERGVEGGFAVRELWHEPRILRTKFTNVVRHGGFLYGLDDGRLECVELASGQRRWKDGAYGHGQLLLAGEHLVVVSEEGEVLCVEASPERPNAVLGRFSALEGKCWGTPALAGAVLVLRNAEECAAWELPLESR